MCGGAAPAPAAASGEGREGLSEPQVSFRRCHTHSRDPTPSPAPRGSGGRWVGAAAPHGSAPPPASHGSPSSPHRELLPSFPTAGPEVQGVMMLLSGFRGSRRG